MTAVTLPLAPTAKAPLAKPVAEAGAPLGPGFADLMAKAGAQAESQAGKPAQTLPEDPLPDDAEPAEDPASEAAELTETVTPELAFWPVLAPLLPPKTLPPTDSAVTPAAPAAAATAALPAAPPLPALKAAAPPDPSASPVGLAASAPPPAAPPAAPAASGPAVLLVAAPISDPPPAETEAEPDPDAPPPSRAGAFLFRLEEGQKPIAPEPVDTEPFSQHDRPPGQPALATVPKADPTALPLTSGPALPLPVDLAATARAESAPLPTSPPPAEQIARAVIAQATPGATFVASAAPSGQLSLLLAPAELGQLRFSLRQKGDKLHVTLSAEQPQTAELLRRNLPDLVAEMKTAGFADANFDFEGWQGPQSGAQSPRPQAPFPLLAEGAEPPPPPRDPASRPALRVSGQLDLRV